MVEHLCKDVSAMIRSSAALPSLHSVVEEVIMNSIDSGCSRVYIRINPDTFSFIVEDDGSGIPFDDLSSKISEWNVTSKSSSYTTGYSPCNTYGMKGEALAAIRSLSQEFIILSRVAGDSFIGVKDIYQHSKDQSLSDTVRCYQLSATGTTTPYNIMTNNSNYSSLQKRDYYISTFLSEALRQHSGTTVFVSNIFWKLPVRQQASRAESELSRLKEFIQRMSILHHNLSWTLIFDPSIKTLLSSYLLSVNDEEICNRSRKTLPRTQRLIFQMNDRTTVAQRLVALHGVNVLLNMQNVSSHYGKFFLSGLISPPQPKFCSSNRECQYSYLHKRWLRRDDQLTNYINKLYNKAFRAINPPRGTIGRHAAEYTFNSERERQGPHCHQPLYPSFVLHMRTSDETASGGKLCDFFVDPDKASAIIVDSNDLRACIMQMLILIVKEHCPEHLNAFCSAWKDVDFVAYQLVERKLGITALQNVCEHPIETTNSVSHNDNNGQDTLLAQFRYDCAENNTRDHFHINARNTPSRSELSPDEVRFRDAFFSPSPDQNSMKNLYATNASMSETIRALNLFCEGDKEICDKDVNEKGSSKRPRGDNDFPTDVRAVLYRTNCTPGYDSTFLHHDHNFINSEAYKEYHNLQDVNDSSIDNICIDHGDVDNEDSQLGSSIGSGDTSQPLEVESRTSFQRDIEEGGTDPSSTLHSLAFRGTHMDWSKASNAQLLDSSKVVLNCDDNFIHQTSKKRVSPYYQRSRSSNYQGETCLRKEDLQSLRFLGQSDNRYLLAMVDDVHSIDSINEQDDVGKNIESSRCLLLAFDQHAVDERIRLESLQANMKSLQKDCNQNHTADKSSEVIAFCEADCDNILLIPHYFCPIVKRRIELLNKWKFNVDINKDITTQLMENSTGERVILNVHGVPSIYGESLTLPDLYEFLQYIYENNELPDALLQPPAVQRILASMACRSAIKFGDVITKDLSISLLSTLGHDIDLPFQCAHGRPSVVPLVNMEETFKQARREETYYPILKYDRLLQN